MTPFPYSIDVDAPLAAAHQLMREHAFRHLPVTEGGALVGMLSDRDIKLILGPDFAGANERELRVREPTWIARASCRHRPRLRPSRARWRRVISARQS